MNYSYTLIILRSLYTNECSLDHEHTDGVDMVGTWPPSTDHDNTRSFPDVSFLPTPLNSRQKSLLNVIRPITFLWRLIQKGVDTTVHVTLHVIVSAFLSAYIDCDLHSKEKWNIAKPKAFLFYINVE